MKNARKKPVIFLMDDAITSRSVLEQIAQITTPTFAIAYFPRRGDMLSRVKKLETENLPTSFILDSSGYHGLYAAESIVQHYEERSAPLPLFCFTSAFVDLSFSACKELLQRNPGLRVNFTSISPHGDESCELITALVQKGHHVQYPCCNGLRQVLNHELGLSLPLTVNDSFYAREYQDLVLAKDAPPTTLPQLLQFLHQENDSRGGRSFQSLCRTAAETLRLVTGNPSEHETLPPSLFGKDGTKVDFLLAVGKAAEGPVAFSLQDVKEHTRSSVLVLNDYPSGGILAPYFNRLAGLVILSPTIADHVEYTLRENGLNGLIGHKDYPAASSASPFIEGDSVRFGDTTLQKGDWVRLRGLVGYKEDMPLSETDKDTLSCIAGKLAEIWPSETRQNLPVFATNENRIPSNDHFVHPVGLFRSETAASTAHKQIEIIAKIIQNEATGEEIKTLSDLLFYDYKNLDRATSAHSSAFCFRLFDFRKKDHFPPNLQNALSGEVYQGGKALKAYPRLYTLQLETLFSGFSRAIHYGYCALPRLEIMMPSLHAIEDVETFVQMVETAAQNDDLSRETDYTIGVMVEQADLCACIEDVAKRVDFIKIGSNDLTASVLGISRGNTAARNLYRQENGFDPFVHPAPEVFERVIPDLIARATRVKPEIKIGICGNHATKSDVIATLSLLGVREFSVAPTDENLFLLPLRSCLEISERMYTPC